MFEAKLADGQCLKKLIESMKDLFADVNFDATSEGLACQAMDSSHVCLCSVLLRNAIFDEFRCDRNITLGMNTVTMSKILKCAGNDESIIMKAEDNADNIHFIFEKPDQDRVSTFEMKLMEIDSEHLGIPDQQYDAKITMPSSELQRICRDLSQFGDTVTLACTKDGISFSCEGDSGKGEIILRQVAHADDDNKSVSIEINEAVTQTYAMRFLIFFTKASALSPQVQLSICKDVPLVTEYKVGTSEHGYIRYFLAPKIDEEDDAAANDEEANEDA